MLFRPRDAHDQRLVEYSLAIVPEPSVIRWSHDVFGNSVTTARFTTRASELRFDSRLRIEHVAVSPTTEALHDHARHYPFSYDADEMPDLLRSIERQLPDPGHVVDRWSHSFLKDRGPTGTLDLLTAMTRDIRHRFTYRARHEPGIQDPRTTLKVEIGTCRDFALLMMEAVRALGLAARFVTGYLHVPRRNPPGEGQWHGGGNTHAWLQVYLPGAGWVDFDPTNGIVGSAGLVRVAVVRDPAMAVPLSGSWTGAAGDCLGMDVSVEVNEVASAAEPIS
jgi:transglutaminase-like putative cysteine protease